MSLTTPRRLGPWLDEQDARWYARADGEVDASLQRAFASRIPTSYDAHQDPDVAARLHRLTEQQIIQATRPHQPSRMDAVIDGAAAFCESCPAWFRTFCRCLVVAVLVFLTAVTLTEFFLICAGACR